jgi:guanylate kinase
MMKPSNYNPESKPQVLVISGPSGAGKDYILNQMKARGIPMEYIVTTTTRARRPGEIDGVHYHFISSDDFKQMIDKGELLEHACVYGNYYGVPAKPVKQALKEGRDVLIKVDVQGAMSIKKALPEAVLLFLMAPTRQELEDRLRRRHTESDAELQRRLQTADAEISQLPLFNYLIINNEGQTEKVVSEILAIMTAEKLKTKSCT